MKILRIFLCLSLIFCTLFTVLFGYKQISKKDASLKQKGYKGIITMWQVDSFEGGSGSRRQFLLDSAIGFEKENDGVLVMINTYTAQGVSEKLQKGEYPDLISYGCGTDINGSNQLTVDKVSFGGKVGKNAYATAWCKGGYVLICKGDKIGDIPDNLTTLSVSQAEYTLPLVALLLEGVKAEKIYTKKPLEAYIDFVNGKSEYLLGTQRDLVRLSNRGINIVVRPLIEYNDLYQYVSVTAKDKDKIYYANKFIEYLLSENVQQKLTKISMLSDFYKIDYQDAYFERLQEVKPVRTISAFTLSVNLIEIQQLSHLALSGDERALNKIKNMLV